MFCNKCGKELKEDARFCKFCGARVPDEYLEIDNSTDQTADDVPEKENNATELIVDEDRGEETVFIGEVREDNPPEPENAEDKDKPEESESEPKDSSKDDGETEIVDPGKTASIMDIPQIDGDAPKKEPGKEEEHQDKSKELKYMGHILDEEVVKQSSEENQKQGSSKTKIVILILSIVLFILIMIAVGLGVYYYMDNKMLREKSAEELVLPDEDRSTESGTDDAIDDEVDMLFGNKE